MEKIKSLVDFILLKIWVGSFMQRVKDRRCFGQGRFSY